METHSQQSDWPQLSVEQLFWPIKHTSVCSLEWVKLQLVMLKGVFREKNKIAEGLSEGTEGARLAEAEG